MPKCAEIFRAINIYYTLKHFDMVSLRIRKQETTQYFSDASYRKTRLSQGLHSDTGLLKKMFPEIVDIIYAIKKRNCFLKHSTKDRLIHINISVVIKRRRDKT